jgi:hypothetical protein
MHLDQSVDRETSLQKQVEDLQSSNAQYEVELELVTTSLADTSTKLSETESCLEVVRTQLRDCQQTLVQSTGQSVCLLGELETCRSQWVKKNVEESLRHNKTDLCAKLDQALQDRDVTQSRCTDLMVDLYLKDTEIKDHIAHTVALQDQLQRLQSSIESTKEALKTSEDNE